MMRNKTLLKAVSIFLLIEMLSNIISPTVSWALTSGPTAPEATSFEPVDATDLVDLSTGDMSYNIPLLEVPGPAGGYPISLSYHAGILPSEEGSWVGLGWTLNPGALTREVSGFADDHKNVSTFDHTFWSGGNTTTYEAGVTMGIGGVVGASADFSFANDTYRGNGMGAALGVNVGLSNSVGLNAKVGISPYGNKYASAGIGVQVGQSSAGSANIGMSAGFATNFSSVSSYANAGLSVSNGYGLGSSGVLGASISSGNGQTSTSFSIAEQSTVSNSKAGNISSDQSGFSLPLPLVSLGYKYERYWIDETENVVTNGALYNPTSVVSNFDTKAFDSYSLLDIEKSITDNPDPDKVIGGSFLNYDHYTVNAQGLNGRIRPYSFKNLIFRQNRKLGENYEVKQYPYSKGYRTEPFEFRFAGDFSNRYRFDGGGIHLNANSPLEPDWEWGTEESGESGSDGITGGHLMGSRHIEWYTNDQILGTDQTKQPAADHFINCRASGFVREGKGSQIGGFKITNESGVTYHFALPAYAFDELQWSENINTFGEGKKSNQLKKPEPYAYTWYLTAITGPDFVDRGPTGTADGLLNEFDWGYWVEFEYGKWTSQYKWRNPETGFRRDLDQNFQNYARGSKELYYLDAIKTKSHVALFIKFLREDSKGVITILGGGFTPRREGNCPGPEGTVGGISYPTSVLGLKKILLLDRSAGDFSETSLTQTKESSQEYFSKETSCEHTSCQCPIGLPDCCPAETINHVEHLGDNVLDITDIISFTNQKIRAIEFNHDYSQQLETPNSLKNEVLYVENPPLTEGSYETGGRLTLKDITFAGKDGLSSIPKTRFSYDIKTPKRGYATLKVTSSGISLNKSDSNLETGDIITFTSNNKTCYSLVETVSESSYSLTTLGKNGPVDGPVSWQQTKNPPYSADKYDLWGMYKSDFTELGNENLSRMTTEKSSRNTDAWSLRSVMTSTGATIDFEYESDTYDRPVLSKKSIFTIKSIQYNETTKSFIFETYEANSELTKYRDIFIGAEVKFLTAREFVPYNTMENFCRCNGRYIQATLPISSHYYDNSIIITEANLLNVTSNSFEVQSNTIFDSLYPLYYTTYTEYPCKERYDDDPVTPQVYVTPGALIGGNVIANAAYDSFGGGLRVSSVSLKDPFNAYSSSTIYEYTQGITPYEPIAFNKVYLDFDWRNTFYDASDDDVMTDLITSTNSEYKNQLYNNFSKLLGVARELPSPGVRYKTVTVREKTNGPAGKFFPNYVEYEFLTFDEPNVGIVSSIENDNTRDDTREDGVDPCPFGCPQYDGITYEGTRTKDVAINDLTAPIGALKRTTLFDENGRKLNETVNHYLHEGLTGNNPERIQEYETRLAPFKYQGAVQETTVDIHFIKHEDHYELLGSASKKKYYPSIQIGQTTTNFKTGISNTNTNLAFDFYSGQVTKNKTSDANGNVLVSEVIPAYRLYPEMGSGANGGKNMLSQVTGTYLFKVDPLNIETKTGVISATQQTWSDQVPALEPNEYSDEASAQTGIWRKKANYTFIGAANASPMADGTYRYENFAPFSTWIQNPTADLWQKSSEITLYDVNSHMLEAKDINDQRAGTIMTADQSRILAVISNANYSEFAFAGAEELTAVGTYGGMVKRNNAVRDPEKWHTGMASLRLDDNDNSGYLIKLKTTTDRKFFHVSAWIHDTNATSARFFYQFSSAGVPISPLPDPIPVVKTIGKESADWWLFEVDIPVPPASENQVVEYTLTGGWDNNSSSPVWIDDFRIHPFESPMISYVYNEFGELSFILDTNNLYTEYKYDHIGRLKSIHKESFQFQSVKTNEYKYRYANQE